MTSKAAAFHAWASSHGMPAYASASVPDDAEPPYITYDFGVPAYGDPAYTCTLDIWTRGSEADANARAGAVLGTLPHYAACDGGALLLTAGSPAWQAVADDQDIKRRYCNVDVENLTTTY